MTLEFFDVEDSECDSRGFVKNCFRAGVKIGASHLSGVSLDSNQQQQGRIGWINRLDRAKGSLNCHSPGTCKIWQDSA